MSCATRLCLCKSGHAWTWRRFFEVWESQMTAIEESRLTSDAEQATGVKYFDVMVDDIPNR